MSEFLWAAAAQQFVAEARSHVHFLVATSAAWSAVRFHILVRDATKRRETLRLLLLVLLKKRKQQKSSPFSAQNLHLRDGNYVREICGAIYEISLLKSCMYEQLLGSLS